MWPAVAPWVCVPNMIIMNLVGACLATGDRIFATGSDSVSKTVLRSCGCFLLDLSAINHGLKGPQKPKTYCDKSMLRSYLSPSVFTVRSGPVWRQDFAILSPEGPRDNTCQLRFWKQMPKKIWGNLFGGKFFLRTVGASLLTVKRLCLQSLKALIRRTFLL